MKGLYALKLTVSVVLVICGVGLGMVFAGSEDESAAGTFVVDFGDYDIRSFQVADDSNAAEALVDFCTYYGLTVVYDGDGNVKTIDGQPEAGDNRSWGLYTLGSGNSWSLVDGDPSSIMISKETGVAWGLCASGSVPTTIVDSTGCSFYNLGTAHRIVCLAPSCTETVCALGGEDLIVGTDRYSNYPASIEQKRNAGIIAETGSYTSPSFETIVKLNPDLVIGIASQYSHKSTCEKLREVGINCIVVGDGEDLGTVYDNTYMTGIAMGLGTVATTYTLGLKECVERTEATVSTVSEHPSVMVALSSDKSPWVAGVNTYISDIYSKSGAVNAFGTDVNGWRQINAEAIVKNNPDIIIVLTSDNPTEADYNNMLNNLSSEWKSTDAYKNGKIYMVCGSATDMFSRPSTRLGELTELMGRILHEDSFSEIIHVPMYFGDDYTDYITYSKTD